MLHIADMTMFYAPASGGVRTYLDAKHQRLKRRVGIRHSLIVPGDKWQATDHLYRVPSMALPWSNGHRFPLRTAPWRQLLEHLEPDIIEVGDPYMPAWAALAAGRSLDVPVVGFYHSDLPLLAMRRLGAWAGRVAAQYVQHLYQQFDLVLTPSESMADRLYDLGVRRVRVQPLGVDLQRFNAQLRDESLRFEVGCRPSDCLLVFAGRGSREKNIPLLIEAVNDLGAGYRLLLIGSDMPTDVPSNVHVINRFCSAEEVARYLASSDVLVHAGMQETFGLVALEGMASGLPAVVCKAGALPELVPAHCGEWYLPNDPYSLAEAVRRVQNRGTRHVGQQARQHMEHRYCWDNVVDDLLMHYHGLKNRLPTSVVIHG